MEAVAAAMVFLALVELAAGKRQQGERRLQQALREFHPTQRDLLGAQVQERLDGIHKAMSARQAEGK
jgi:hypothetical protein